MSMSSVADVIHRGRTILHTAGSERFKQPEGKDLAAARIKGASIGEHLVVIGEDFFQRND